MKLFPRSIGRIPGLQPGRRISSAVRSEFSRFRIKHTKSLVGKRFEIDFPVKNSYFITTEQGVFRLDRNVLIQLTTFPIYGIAICKESVYLSTFCYPYSIIVKGRVDALFNEGRRFEFREVYSDLLLSSTQRMHQIFGIDDTIIAANTNRNTVLEIDRHSGAVIREFAPFLDTYGRPILYDHNHINSVFKVGNVTMFVAYRAGNNAMLCVCNDEEVAGYAYENPGVHDIFLSDGRLIFCDTFGAEVENGGGSVVVDGELLDKEFFSGSENWLLRGVSGCWDELVIGHSHKGDRKRRFEGHGAIFLARNGRIVAHVETPFSAVYDIVLSSGEAIGVMPVELSYEDACGRLESALGAASYRGPLIDMQSSAAAAAIAAGS